MMLFESAVYRRKMSELRRHVKVEVDVPDSDSLYDLGGRKAVPTKKKKRKMYDKELSDRCSRERNASVPPVVPFSATICRPSITLCL